MWHFILFIKLCSNVIHLYINFRIVASLYIIYKCRIDSNLNWYLIHTRVVMSDDEKIKAIVIKVILYCIKSQL